MSASCVVIDADSQLTVCSMISNSNLNSDSTGDGILNYGTTQTLNIDAANNNRLWEMTVSFEDLTGNPVDADWQTLGFSGTASSGSAVLPVSEMGSEIIATFAGVGALSMPTGVKEGLTQSRFRLCLKELESTCGFCSGTRSNRGWFASLSWR